MKKILTTIGLVMAMTFAQGQLKSDTLTKKITQPADSVQFVCMKDFDNFLKWLPNNVVYSEYIGLKPEQVIVLFYRFAVTEWNNKKKKN